MSQHPESPLSPLLLKLEQAPGLDQAVQLVSPLVKAVSGNPAVLEALQGRKAGHALHPVLVQLPLGTWTSAALLDVTGADDDGAPSQLLTAVGLASAVPAILTGLAEVAPASQAEKRVAVVHVVANVVGAGLQAGALVQRSRRNGVAATLCSLASMTVLGAAGYLGGHLAVSRGVGSHDRVFDEQPA